MLIFFSIVDEICIKQIARNERNLCSMIQSLQFEEHLYSSLCHYKSTDDTRHWSFSVTMTKLKDKARRHETEIWTSKVFLKLVLKLVLMVAYKAILAGTYPRLVLLA